MKGPRRTNEKSKDFKGSMKRLIKNLKKWKSLMIISLILAAVSSILSLISPNQLSNFADEIGVGLVPRSENFEVISKKMMETLTPVKIKEKTALIMSSNISDNDKLAFKTFLTSNSNEEFFNLPDSVLNILLEDIVVDGVLISTRDQILMIKQMENMNDEKATLNALKAIDNLPDSVYSLIDPKMNTDKIKKIAIFLGIIIFLTALFSYIQSLCMTHVSNNFAKRLRNSISDKINKLPLKYFDTHETGDILSRITNDIDTIAQNLNNSLATIISSITLFLGSIFMMFITNWVMALTAIVSSLVGFLFMGKILSRSQKYFAESQKSLGDLNGYIEEIYSGHNVVRVYNGTNKSIEDFEVLNHNLYEAKRKSIFLSGTMQPLMGFIGNLGYVAVCIVGALLTMNGYISFGVIVAFMLYVRLFTNPLSQIAQAMTNLQSTAAASERVFEFLDEEEMKNEDNLIKSISKEDIKGDIEFRGVKFGYGDKIVIKDFSAKAKKGEKIALVGETGAGKTTMVNLLMKFYEVNDGDILIDGISTKEISRDAIHNLFIMVLQDTWLFEGTIRDNLKFNKKDVSDKELWEALKNVGADHFVKTLPGGLDYVINDADSISQGEKQLLTIARGMISDAPFLILDEATSNVDTRTEELVSKAMDKLIKGKTSFIIAHRLSTIKNADNILVLKDGNIIEQGTHDELMNMNGAYAELYNSQFRLQ